LRSLLQLSKPLHVARKYPAKLTLPMVKSVPQSRASGMLPISVCPVPPTLTQRRSAPPCNYSSSFQPPFPSLRFIIFLF
jgi:hypothetical protein